MIKKYLFSVVCLSLTLAATASAEENAVAIGERLFTGALPLSATLRHSNEQLPQAAITCSNCHMVGCTAGQTEPAAPPTLGPLHLLSEVRRISGPPVAYDVKGFCHVLETGRTPAHTVTARTMPQYTMDAQSCAALWAYLTGESHACQGS